ncbi:MAG: hypothetical protein E7271_01300 [Lachnospiraceae bacterium]|jgi:hypothetical protein|nr:hypothetical protein [Lachnospiraceae bacterium]
MDNNQESFVSHVDQLLYQKNYEEIDSLFSDELIQNADYDELAYLSLFILTYRNEKTHHINKTSLSLGDSTAELILFFRKIKFLLWEFEFDRNEESTSQLINTITDNDLSTEFLKTVILTSSVNKEKILLDLANLFS